MDRMVIHLTLFHTFMKELDILGLGGSGCLGQSDEGRRDPQAAEEAEAAEPQTLEVKPWTHDFLGGREAGRMIS